MLVVVTSDPQSAFWNVKNILRLVNVTMLQTSDHEIPIKVRAAQDCRSRITNWNYVQHLRDLLEKENELNLLVIACCTNCRAIWLHCRIKVLTVLCIFSMAFMCCIVDCLAFSSSLPFSYISKATSWIVTGQTRKYCGVLKWKPLWTLVYCAKCLSYWKHNTVVKK